MKKILKSMEIEEGNKSRFLSLKDKKREFLRKKGSTRIISLRINVRISLRKGYNNDFKW
jgi:hypothetical protein